MDVEALGLDAHLTREAERARAELPRDRREIAERGRFRGSEARNKDDFDVHARKSLAIAQIRWHRGHVSHGTPEKKGSVLGADIVLLTGGVSAGDADYVPGILTKLKVKEVFHKTAIKPGKPLWFGTRGKTRVFGIPGNPWSSQVVFKIYIEPYLCHAFGMEPPLRLSLPLAKERNKKDTLQHFFPVRVANRSGSASELEALSFNGSGDIRAGLGSDGLAVHPAHKKELKRGDIVEFIPW